MKIGIADIENSKKLCEYFEINITYQNLAFIEMLKTYCRPKEEYFLDNNKFTKKFLLWQNCENPKVKLYDAKEFPIFSHDNDLSWNTCQELYKKYIEYVDKKRKEDSEKNSNNLPELKLEVGTDDPMYQALLQVNLTNE